MNNPGPLNPTRVIIRNWMKLGSSFPYVQNEYFEVTKNRASFMSTYSLPSSFSPIVYERQPVSDSGRMLGIIHACTPQRCNRMLIATWLKPRADSWDMIPQGCLISIDSTVPERFQVQMSF